MRPTATRTRRAMRKSLRIGVAPSHVLANPACMTRDRGQASVEYLGVVALVCAVLAGAALTLPALARRDVGSAIAGSMRGALCVLGRGDCDIDARPCVVASDAVQDEASVDLLLVRLAGRAVALREDRSDGTVAVTYMRDGGGGLDLAVGGGGRLRLGKRTLRMGAQAEATLLATIGSATTWILPGAGAADRLMDALVVHSAGGLARRIAHGGAADTSGFPAPAWTSSRRGLAVSLGAGSGPASLSLGGDELYGVATERAMGRRTYAVRRRNDLAAALTVGPRDAAGIAAGADELYTVTVDRDGRPIDLGVLGGRELGAGAGPAGGAMRRETEEHLDLTDPDNLAAARAFLSEVVAPHPRLGRAVDVSGALRGRLDADGVVDERTYALSDSTTGLGAATGTGIGHAGADFDRHERRLRLIGARERGLDGLWHTRD